MLFDLVFSRFYAFFYDLSSLGNFYSVSVDIIVSLFLEGREGGVPNPSSQPKFGPNPSSQANFCQNPIYQIFRCV